MLDDLLKIKNLREDDAVAALARAKAALEEKEAARAQKQRQQADYKVWRIAEERRLHEKIHGQNVKLEKLEKLRETIAAMRQRELQLEDECVQAGQEEESARQALSEARQKRLAAHKDVVKYEEYNQLLLDEEYKEQQRRQELEMEDFVSGKPGCENDG